MCCFGHLLLKSLCCVCSHFDFWFCSVAPSMRRSHRYFIFSLFQYCMMDWYLQVVSTHAYVVLEIECHKFVDCMCVVSVICFWKVYVVFCSIHKITKWFLFLFYHIRISLINFINVKISFQGGAVYISGGSGTFDSCSFDGNSSEVSTHDIGFEIECSKFVDCICVRILIFDFVLLHIACGCLTDSLIFPLFQYCMIDRDLQDVSTHGYVVLEIECSKLVDCICVVSVICFWKVYVVYVHIWFLILFCCT